MSDLDGVLDRLTSDPAFRAELDRDPRAALAGYELTTDELAVLTERLTDGSGDGPAAVRTRRAALFALLTRRRNERGGEP